MKRTSGPEVLRSTIITYLKAKKEKQMKLKRELAKLGRKTSQNGNEPPSPLPSPLPSPRVGSPSSPSLLSHSSAVPIVPLPPSLTDGIKNILNNNKNNNNESSSTSSSSISSNNNINENNNNGEVSKDNGTESSNKDGESSESSGISFFFFFFSFFFLFLFIVLFSHLILQRKDQLQIIRQCLSWVH